MPTTRTSRLATKRLATKRLATIKTTTLATPRTRLLATLCAALLSPFGAAPPAGVADAAEPLAPIRVSADGSCFVRGPDNERFVIWGVNYDHDAEGRLLEEYWFDDWDAVVGDFREIKALGANCARVHLQFGKFVDAPDRTNAAALAQLAKLVRLAEETGLYLNITGLACYHKQHVPAWYDKLEERERWAAQAVFWEAVARTCRDSPAIFCLDLMNEPILPGAEPAAEWLTGELAGKFFVQRLTLDLKGRSREEVAAAWVDTLVDAIRKHDRRALVTVGEIPWVFVFGGGKPFFGGSVVGKRLDFVSAHFYPKRGEVDKALKALAAYEVGKPLLVEEMFPLACDGAELTEFVEKSASHVDGWMSFYWGAPAAALRAKPRPTLAEALTADWLDRFAGMSDRVKTGRAPSEGPKPAP